MRTADVVVVGLGAAGSATLYHLARRGVEVIGLDRYSPPHTMGSTHGGSRIIRRAYSEGTAYLPLLNRAYTLWNELENVSGEKLVTWCGCLNIGPQGCPRLAAARHSAGVGDVEVRLMNPAEVKAAFPAYNLSDFEVALYEPGAGFIDPERCVATHISQAETHGANVFRNEALRSWEFNGDGVKILTESGTIHAQKMVLTAGAWITTTLSDKQAPPVVIERVMNAWYATEDDSFHPEHCPTFIWDFGENASYGFPDFGKGLKAGLHHMGTLSDTPMGISRDVHETESEALHALLSNLFSDKLGRCTYTTICMYTNTPDKHYLLDYLQGHDKRVVVGSACSGHGFKASAAVGEALADLAMEKKPLASIESFRWRWPGT